MRSKARLTGLWKVKADPAASEGKAVRIKAFTEFRRAGEVEGLDFDPMSGEMVVLNNRGERIIKGMPSGLYPGYDREIHELYVYRFRLSRTAAHPFPELAGRPDPYCSMIAGRKTIFRLPLRHCRRHRKPPGKDNVLVSHDGKPRRDCHQKEKNMSSIDNSCDDNECIR